MNSKNKDLKNKYSGPAVGEATYEQVKEQYRFYFNIVKRRYIWFIISLIFIVPGVISLFVQGLNLGIDYTGGSLFNIKFEQAVTQEKVTEALDSVGLTGSVQLTDGNKQAIIRTVALEEEKRDSLMKALQGAGKFNLQNVEEDKVGPSIGAELRKGALKAIVVASILILAYMSFRFRFAFALSGLVALFHDILIILGFFSIFQWQIDAAFIAAVLTVFGYSINDSVVVFDRIRENSRRLKKKDSYEDMVDKSVWQTMGRSIKTTATVVIALLAIFILGGESTKVFALAMLIGVISGAYSSIFIASQLMVEIKKRFGGDNKRKSPAQA
ncbi:MAG: protein translocase subunit SecF [Desulfitobacteriia bacterium]|jgi:preprotein translocase SecF subunit